MAGTSKSIQKYFRTVDQANAALAQRWRGITHQLRLGLAMPIPTSAILLRTFEPTKDYVGASGKRHRMPVRALYGFGDAARQRFADDSTRYQLYAASLKKEVDTANTAVAHWIGRAKA